MGDVASYRIVRSPQVRVPGPDSVHRPVATTFKPPGKPMGQAEAEAYVADPTRFVDPTRAAPPELGDVVGLADGLRALDTWLTSVDNRPDIAAFTGRLTELVASAGLGSDLAATVANDKWAQLSLRQCNSLVASLTLGGALRLQSPRRSLHYSEQAMRLSRRLLVAGLVEWATSHPATTEDVYRLLHDRHLVLPDFVPISRARDALVRRPGFADLYVVRSEWCCYLAGEIAHIDNVMMGELRERVHTRLDETEITQTDESESKSTEERDTQTTDRFTLDAEASLETSLKLAINASVDTSGQYGPTRVNTHVGGSFDYSQDESRKLATTQAHELVARAVNKVEQTVRKSRTVRTLNRVTETNTHRVDATNKDAHVVGMYRWVDKVQTVQLFRYRHRYLLEFQIPEPAAFHVWAHEKAAAEGSEPLPSFTDSGRPDGIPLTVRDIDERSYAMYAARYGAADIPPPPPTERVVETSVALEAELPDYAAKSDQDINLRAAPQVTKTVELPVPDGYAATDVVATAAAAPALARWGDVETEDTPVLSDNHYAWRWGYHYPRVDITVGDQHLALHDDTRLTVEEDGHKFKESWLPTGITASGRLTPAIGGKVTVGFTSAGSYRSTVSVSLTCRATTAGAAWAADAYARIRAAWQASHEAETDSALSLFGPASSPFGDADPPEFNKRIVHEELKRQVLELLFGGSFDGYSLVTRGENTRPRLDPSALEAAAPYIQFLEQAFEWDNLTYTFYPYFWADQEQWTRLAARRSADPDFADFLRAGTARVVVPARPQFESAVNAYLDYGVVWSGGPAPSPEDPLYLSIADEIREMQQGTAGGEPGDSWQVRLPTTLVWLDDDRPSDILKTNGHSRLTPPADSLCAAHEE